MDFDKFSNCLLFPFRTEQPPLQKILIEKYTSSIVRVYDISNFWWAVYFQYTPNILHELQYTLCIIWRVYLEYAFDVGVLFFLLQYEISILQIYYSSITDGALFKVLFFFLLQWEISVLQIYCSSINDH